MKRWGRGVSVVMVLSQMGWAVAQVAAVQAPRPAAEAGKPGEASRPGGQAIATLAFNTAVLQTAEAQRDLGALETKFAPRQAHLEALSKEVEGLRAQLGVQAGAQAGARPGAATTEADGMARRDALSARERELGREAEDFKNDSEAASQKAFQAVALKMYAFVQEYGRRQGYALVVERGSEGAPVVWYAGSNVDITEEVVRAYNGRPGGVPGAGGARPGGSLPGAPTPRPTGAASH